MSDLIHGSATAEAAATAVAPLGRPRHGLVAGLARSPLGLIGLILLTGLVTVAVFADMLAPYDPLVPSGPVLAPPSGGHPMGTDALGRDLLSGVIHGTRTSLMIAVGVGALVVVIGAAVGGVAGYAGGRTDDLLMRLTEVVQVLPRFFLAILAIALFGPSMTNLVLVLGLTSWVIFARVIRAEVLTLKSRDFVEIARAQGARAPRILILEIFPNALPVGVVYLALLLAHVILLEASLGFLGLGDPNAISWGYLAGQAQRFLRVGWWLSVFPGAAVTMAVLGLNLLGDGLTDVLGGRR